MARRSKGKSVESRKITDFISNKTPCKYGSSCYQKNAEHHKRYSHPSKDTKTAPTKRKHEDEEQEDTQQNKHKRDEVPQKSLHDTDEGGQVSEDKDVSEEDVEFPPSPDNIRDKIKEKFLVDMPEDFYLFWDFCKTLDEAYPEDTLMKSLQLKLVGPYDVLTGKLTNKCIKKKSEFLCHWRYYYDPPEFMTVLKRDDDELFHIGYFRDDPSEPPAFLASNCAAKDCTFRTMGDNLFAAVNTEITSSLRREKDSHSKEKLMRLQSKLTEFAKSKKLSLDQSSNKIKARDKKVVAKTFHKAGIVVPLDKNDVGYRPLPESDANLKKLLKNIVESKTEKQKETCLEEFQKIITFIQFANDECDYGMGLEFCIDLFCFGDSYFHPNIDLLLPLAYQLLGRPEYGEIIQAHLKNRRKGGPAAQSLFPLESSLWNQI